MRTLFSCFPIQALLFGGLLVGGVAFVNDLGIRNERSDLLQRFQIQNIIVDTINCYADLTSVSAIGLRFRGERAEIFVTDDTLFYFGCLNFLGISFYRRFLPLYQSIPETLSATHEKPLCLLESVVRAGYLWEIRFRRAQPMLVEADHTLLLSDLNLDAEEVLKQFSDRLNKRNNA